MPLKYFQNFNWGERIKISRIRYEDGVQLFEQGNPTGNTLYINQENMYIVEQEQIDIIYHQINGLEVYSFEGDTIIDPALDVGDILIIDGKKIIYQGSSQYMGKFKANISSKIQCKSKEETTTKTQSQTVINRRVQSQIDQENLKITQLVETTKQIETKADNNSTELHNNYQDIIQKLGDYAKEADIVTIKESVQTIQNESSLAVEIAKQVQTDGVTRLDTKTGFTFGEDGLNIEKTGAKVKSNLDETGLEIQDTTGASDESLLFVGYDEETGETIAKVKNMSVEKYLVIGKYSRLEDFIDENDNLGTGMFWIGG